MIWAVYTAPQKTLEAQWKLQQRDEARKRRLQIFTTLMATRGNILDYRYVEALNLIDLEFAETAEQDIRDAWKHYLDHLSNYPVVDVRDEATRQSVVNQREANGKDLLAQLLNKMGKKLGYDFEFTYLKSRAYYPIGHGREMDEQGAVRRGLIKVLWEGRPLFIRPVEPPVQAAENKGK